MLMFRKFSFKVSRRTPRLVFNSRSRFDRTSSNHIPPTTTEGVQQQHYINGRSRNHHDNIWGSQCRLVASRKLPSSTYHKTQPRAVVHTRGFLTTTTLVRLKMFLQAHQTPTKQQASLRFTSYGLNLPCRRKLR
jgi:hypothetical protein